MDASPLVLVVDDERLMRITLRHRLTLEGYRVDLARSGREATDRLLRFRYDLVLTDLRLQDCCGIEVVRTAHQVDPLLPVIILTGSGDDPAIDEAMAEGAVAVIPKPCKLADVAVQARRAIEARPAP